MQNAWKIWLNPKERKDHVWSIDYGTVKHFHNRVQYGVYVYPCSRPAFVAPWHWHWAVSVCQLTKSSAWWYIGLERVESFHFPSLVQSHQCGPGSSYGNPRALWWHHHKFQVPNWLAGRGSLSLKPNLNPL